MSRKAAKRSKDSADKANDAPAYVQRTLVLAHPGPNLNAACLALTLQAKNLYNTSHFCVNNVLTAFEREKDAADNYTGPWRRKPALHANQSQMIDRFNRAVERLNAGRQRKYDEILAAGGDAAKKARLTLIPLLGQEVESVYRTVLDMTVLDNVLRDYPGLDGTPVYSRLPAKASQQAIRRYLNAWSGHFESSRKFSAGGAAASAMTGRPRAPGYLATKSRYVVELPLTQIGPCLIGLGDRTIPVDFEETVALTEDQLTAWNDYRIGDAVKAACAKRGLPENSTPQHLRIVPHKGGVKLEVVVRVRRALPENSLLAKIEAANTELPKSGSARNEMLAAIVAEMHASSALTIAGMDTGVTNTCTVAFSDGSRAKVISAERLEAVLTKIDQRLDALVAELTTAEIRDLQKRKAELRAKEQRLPREDERKLRKALKNIFADRHYVALRAQRQRWLLDYMHKLSRGIVEMCWLRKVQVLVVGQNKGWKDGMDLGKTQNRRFGRIPIGQLIDLIRYKAESLGIVVVATEESYTSKSSFVNNEALRVLSEDRKKAKKGKSKDVAAQAATQETVQQVVETVESASAQAEANPGPEHIALGKRLKHDRHTFVNHQRTGRWARVHADVNGAFNIIRKVFKSFKFHENMTLKYTLLRLSPRLGLTAMRI